MGQIAEALEQALLGNYPISPALARGAWVVSDRFVLSNVVYQGHAGGIDPEVIRGVADVATGGLHPDLVIVLDVDLETSARRLDRPLDKLENRGDGYRRRVHAGYHAEAARSPGKVVVVDATGGIDEVAARIRRVVAERFAELA